MDGREKEGRSRRFPLLSTCRVTCKVPRASTDSNKTSIHCHNSNNSPYYSNTTLEVLLSLNPMPKEYMVKPGSHRLPLCLRFRLWLASLIYEYGGETQSPKVVRIPFRQLVKFRCHRSEFEAMGFVSANTTIPIPRVTEVYNDGELQHLVMEYVEGELLDTVWQTMTAQEKQAIVEELTSYVDQLRSLVPSRPGAVGSTTLSSGYDHRLGGNRFGPYESIADFHRFVRRETGPHAWEESVARVHSRPGSYTTKYTHGDLCPNNILIHKGKIAAIVDWEFAGWYPEYWEYTKMYYGWRPYRKEFYDALDQTLPRYPEELTAENAIWRVFDTFEYDVPLGERRQSRTGGERDMSVDG